MWLRSCGLRSTSVRSPDERSDIRGPRRLAARPRHETRAPRIEAVAVYHALRRHVSERLLLVLLVAHCDNTSSTMMTSAIPLDACARCDRRGQPEGWRQVSRTPRSRLRAPVFPVLVDGAAMPWAIIIGIIHPPCASFGALMTAKGLPVRISMPSLI